MTFDEFSAHVISSLFANFSLTGDGGAINYQNNGIEIFCSEFSNCQAKSYGGAIYLNYSNNSISNTNFESCFVRNHTNANFGNCLYGPNCASQFEMNIMHKCGPDPQNGGDSACALSNLVVIVKKLNATENFGVGGAGSISLMRPSDGTAVSFIQCVDIQDGNFLEWYYTSNKISKCNFINKTHDNYLFYIYDTTITIIDSCFINTSPTLLLGGGKIILSNCQSNVSYSGYAISPLLYINSYQFYICYNKNIRCKSHLNDFSYSRIVLHLLFFVLTQTWSE